jgi:predicted O-methyltransferase YrrM
MLGGGISDEVNSNKNHSQTGSDRKVEKIIDEKSENIRKSTISLHKVREQISLLQQKVETRRGRLFFEFGLLLGCQGLLLFTRQSDRKKTGWIK